jgi:hypothetical protein
MQNVKSWNPRDGEYEHPLLHSAEAWRSRIENIQRSIIPDRLAAICEAQMKRNLTRLFNEAEFAKSIPLIGLVDVIKQLGFQPVVIVNYRTFQDYARSISMSRPFWDMPRLIERYAATYSTAILQLELFGGCTIAYDELVRPDETQWARVLAEITPASEETILECRDKRVRAAIALKDRAEPISGEVVIRSAAEASPRHAELPEGEGSIAGEPAVGLFGVLVWSSARLHSPSSQRGRVQTPIN